MCNPNTSAANRRRSFLSQRAGLMSTTPTVSADASNKQQQQAYNTDTFPSSSSTRNQQVQAQQQQQPFDILSIMWMNNGNAGNLSAGISDMAAGGLSLMPSSSDQMAMYRGSNNLPSTNNDPSQNNVQLSFDTSLLFLAPSADISSNSGPHSGKQKPKPKKRRRKPQKPGKTAKQHDRHFVIHNYHDHGQDTEEETLAFLDLQKKEQEAEMQAAAALDNTVHRRKGGVAVSFPAKLHAILDQVDADGLSHVISWQPHGRCFLIRDVKLFSEHVMPLYFRQTKLTSFQRQLNLYGFNRLTRGPDAGGYYHELFLRNKAFLTKRMVRTKIKGTKFKAASSPDQEPDFYAMEPVSVSPASSVAEGAEPADTSGAVTPPSSVCAPPPIEHNISSNSSPVISSDIAPARNFSPAEIQALMIQAQAVAAAANCMPNSAPSSYATSSQYYDNNMNVVPEDLTPTPLSMNNIQRSTKLVGQMRFPPFLQENAVAEDFASLFGGSTLSSARRSSVSGGGAILDQAVDDLFSSPSPQGIATNSNMDFASAFWDTISPEAGTDTVLETDQQLGNVLDKLMQEW